MIYKIFDGSRLLSNFIVSKGTFFHGFWGEEEEKKEEEEEEEEEGEKQQSRKISRKAMSVQSSPGS